MSLGKRLISVESAIPDSQSFNTVLYTGNGSTQSITGVGFKPDIVWIKPRSFADNHALSDSTNGVNKSLAPNTTAAIQTTLGVTSFDNDGFSLPNWGNVNQNGATFVAWCWKAGGGTTSSNTDGSITSTVQVSNASGFSIVKWTGTGAQGTIGHGLSSTPEMIISKRLDATNNWSVYHKDLSLSHSTYPDWMYLNLANAEQNSASSANHPFYAAPSSTLIYQNTGTSESTNVSGGEYISYCFHSVSGFSKIGSYTGNGSTSGPTITTGFQPDWLLVKDRGTGNSWRILDSSRSTSNPRNDYLDPNTSSAEGTSIYSNVDFNSNDFQLKNLGSNYNNSGRTYLYWAIKNN